MLTLQKPKSENNDIITNRTSPNFQLIRKIHYILGYMQTSRLIAKSVSRI